MNPAKTSSFPGPVIRDANTLEINIHQCCAQKVQNLLWRFESLLFAPATILGTPALQG
jgi:hypothetical protein